MNKENLVIKMYFDHGLSVNKIADILEENELYISEIIENNSPIKMISSIHKYNIKRISAETYYRLSKKAILINPMHMFTQEMQDYLESYGLTGISEIYYVLSLFFGDSVEYDEYKSSYRYLFYIEVFGIEDDNLKDKYLVSLVDIKGSLEVFFVKIAPGKTQDTYNTYHKKYVNLEKRKMKKIWFWFMAFVKNSIKYLKNNHLRIKPFYKTIEAMGIIYGYKGNGFFAEQYIEDENDFDNICFKYKEQIKREIKSNKGEYGNKLLKYISQIIDETNQNSLPRYEFSLLYYNIFEQVVGYTSQQYRDDFDEYQENTEILTGFIVYFLAFKDKGELENYFNENEKMMNFNYDSFKTIMEEVDSVLKKQEYKILEINNILKKYKEQFNKVYLSQNWCFDSIQEKIYKINYKVINKIIIKDSAKKVSLLLMKRFI